MSDFPLKQALRNHVQQLLASNATLVVLEVPRELLWAQYLSGYPEAEQKSFDCNSCRSFLNHYGSLAAIIGTELKSIWDFDAPSGFENVVNGLRALCSDAPIRELFITDTNILGYDHNFGQDADGKAVRWDHLSLVLPVSMATHVPHTTTFDSIRGELRTTKQVLVSSLTQIKPEAVERTLELIEQNQLYRAEEYKQTLLAFQSIQQDYNNLPTDHAKELAAWVTSKKTFAGNLSRIKNQAIGTFLLDLSEGKDLEQSMRAFERIMAPANYKRPEPKFTGKQLEAAKTELADLGLLGALNRRFATPDDLDVSKLHYLNQVEVAQDVFTAVAGQVTVNPKQYEKLAPISVEAFLKLIEKATNVELLLEGRHEPNMVSLITSDDNARLFKWDNTFSWSYNNAVASGIKEKVKAAGGSVTGKLRISLAWHNSDDLDLHVHEPSGYHIYYASSSSPYGRLDVDMNAGGRMNAVDPVENVTYERTVPNGRFQVQVNNYSRRGTANQGYTIEVEYEGQLYSFTSAKSPAAGHTDRVTTFEINGGNINILDGTAVQGGLTSREVWGVKTNQFHKVTAIMPSPNYWQNEDNKSGVGNRHTFFILDKARNEGEVRGFFNEMIRGDLDKHRKVFEALGGSAKVTSDVQQVSGVGFDSTSSNSAILRVTHGGKQQVVKVAI